MNLHNVQLTGSLQNLLVDPSINGDASPSQMIEFGKWLEQNSFTG